MPNVFDPDRGAIGRVLDKLFPSPPPPEATVLAEHAIETDKGAPYATMRLVEERREGSPPRLVFEIKLARRPGYTVRMEGRHDCAEQFARGAAALAAASEAHAKGAG